MPPDPGGPLSGAIAEDAARLRRIKALHSFAWGFFVVSILGIWIGAALSRFAIAGTCIGLVTIEVITLLFNGWKCPLTAVAARYTSDRRPNFDIYLPEWLARYNKEIFGPLFVAGVVYAVIRWTARAS